MAAITSAPEASAMGNGKRSSSTTRIYTRVVIDKLQAIHACLDAPDRETCHSNTK